MTDFEEALERIVAGPERKSRVISDAEKLIIAYHEGGHAVVQRILPKCDPVQKVTIISRGMALGYTMALPTEDRYLQSKTEFEDKIAGLLGGNVSERMVFGDTTTGSSNDIEKATDLARRMVTEFGMSERLGPLSFGKRDELVFLGREIGEQRNYSDEIAKTIDEEVRAIVDRAFERATQVLETHRDRLDALAAEARSPRRRSTARRSSRCSATSRRRRTSTACRRGASAPEGGEPARCRPRRSSPRPSRSRRRPATRPDDRPAGAATDTATGRCARHRRAQRQFDAARADDRTAATIRAGC